MQQPIRAFVGHSFAKGDAQVVDAILKCLSRIAALHPNFSWQNAQDPEPELVDVKVLARFADKNTFIAICTRSERVVAEAALATPWYARQNFTGPKDAFVWKASDWIIQEIGFAVACGLKLVLLIEEGVRPPGAMQGNLECIEIDRAAPEKCFDKLLGMIAALSPKSSTPNAVAVQESQVAGPQVGAVLSDAFLAEWTHPKPDWELQQYEIAAMHFIGSSDEAGTRELTNAFLASKEGESDDKRQHFAAWKEYWRILHGRSGDLAKLEQLANGATQADIVDYLGQCYAHFGENARAARTFADAAELCAVAVDKTRLLGESAVALERAGQRAAAFDAEAAMRLHAETDRAAVTAMLEAEVKLADLRKEDDLMLAALEHLLELNPSDNETRFSAAYKYDSVDQKELAMFHYLRIPVGQRSAAAWNNLGVSFDGLGMPIRSVDAYRKSDEGGETLAMSNLAKKLLDVGFLKQAQTLLERGLQIKDHHRNVDSTLALTKTAPEEEGVTESAAIDKAKPLSEFYRRMGRAFAMPLRCSLTGSWHAPKCTLEVAADDKTFVGAGTYEVTSGLNAISQLAGTVGQRRRYRIEHRGVVKGRTVIGTVVKTIDGEQSPQSATTLLGGADPETKVLMWLSDDAAELNVLEHGSGGTGRTYKLQRVVGP